MKAKEARKLIIGQEIVCSRGLGRVVEVIEGICDRVAVRVDTYIKPQGTCYDCCNVKLPPSQIVSIESTVIGGGGPGDSIDCKNNSACCPRGCETIKENREDPRVRIYRRQDKTLNTILLHSSLTHPRLFEGQIIVRRSEVEALVKSLQIFALKIVDAEEELSKNKCTNCRGLGKVSNDMMEHATIDCEKCGGTGYE